MSYEYVSNKRITMNSEIISFEKNDDEDFYRLNVLGNHYNGPVVRIVKLSKDDIKALYLMLDDVVGTF